MSNVPAQPSTEPEFILDRMVTVCANCYQASCWHGIFMCDGARIAGIVDEPVGYLAYLNREAADFWFRDASTGEVDEEAVHQVLCYDRNALQEYVNCMERAP